MPFQTLGGEHKEQTDGWNFKTAQGQQLTEQRRGGKYSPDFSQLLSNAAFVASTRDKLSVRALGAFKSLSPFKY